MTRIRWIGEIAIFALLSITALYVMAPFHSKVAILLVLVAPILIFFVLPSAFRSTWETAKSLVHSFAWWHWLVLFALLGGLNYRMQTYDLADISANPVDTSVKLRLIFDALVATILLARLLTRKTAWLRPLFRGVFGMLTFFVLLALLTTLWSVKPYWTFYKSLEYGLDVALIVAVAVSVKNLLEYRLLLNWVYGLCGALVALALLEAIFMPGSAFDYGLGGAFTFPELTGVFPSQSANGLGTFGAIISIVALYRLLAGKMERSDRGWYQMILIFGLVTMFMTEARSAIGAFLAATILLLVLTRRVVTGTIIGVGTAFVLAISGIGRSLIDYLMRGQTAFQFNSVTGRTEVWAVAWQKIAERPFIGWGAYAGGRFVVLPLLHKSAAADVDSTIVETLLDTGVIGLVALLLVVFVAGYFLLRAYKSRRLDYAERGLALECLLVLTVMAFRCAFVSNLTRHPALPFLAVVGFAELVRRRLKSGT